MTFEQASETASFIRNSAKLEISTAIVLGSGLGQLAEAIEAKHLFEYEELPHFPKTTVDGHMGRLIIGQLAGKTVAVLAGRFHYYEGWSMQQLTFPIRVLHSLGVRRIFLSNAAGSVNPAHEVGDIVFIRDHINLMPSNPLRGPNDDRWGPRFPDMLDAYDPHLMELALAEASAMGVRCHTGVYAALQGPNFETPAEYAWLHRIGADLAGMSTVPEVLVARHMGMQVLAASIVTDLGYPPERIQPTSHEAVLAVAQETGARLGKIFQEVLKKL
ncbi:MAG: purine nucleoside phosphorylase [Saprospiraceae bacterium]|nr:MAG: purine nucleoside phosphorylase [Saprospiraceae bacterium]